MSKKVSVVIPVYNGEKYLRVALDSVLESNFEDYEIVCVDDGSKDASYAILEEYSAKYPDRFILDRFEKNKGMDFALNRAIGKLSGGEFIARMNQDDLIEPERLKAQVEFLDANPSVVCVGSQLGLIDASGNQIGEVAYPATDDELKARWNKLSPFADPAVMYRKSAWVTAGPYMQEFWPADDIHMWYRMGTIGELANLGSTLTHLRWHEDGGSFKTFRKQVKATWKVRAWARSHLNVKFSLSDWLFAIVQYFLGMILTPKTNWGLYKVVKKIFAS